MLLAPSLAVERHGDTVQHFTYKSCAVRLDGVATGALFRDLAHGLLERAKEQQGVAVERALQERDGAET